MGLASRHLEANGIPTVVLGSARDIIEHCGVARFLFTDFPLGNPCGRPWDRAMQRRIVRAALALFSRAREPRTTLLAPEGWPDDAWRDNYMRVDDGNRAELARMGEELRARRAVRERRPT